MVHCRRKLCDRAIAELRYMVEDAGVAECVARWDCHGRVGAFLAAEWAQAGVLLGVAPLQELAVALAAAAALAASYWLASFCSLTCTTTPEAASKTAQ